ncbi:MAG: hypothetical protein K2R98_31575 [Gemmataceae bacterium]|nr:hypothetical protein [Gemmataceae bacterium]
MYVRFRIAQLLRQKEERERRVITWKEVGEQTGISTSVLSNLASPSRQVFTNTRYVASLMGYFGLRDFNDLLVLESDEPEASPNE